MPKDIFEKWMEQNQDGGEPDTANPPTPVSDMTAEEWEEVSGKGLKAGERVYWLTVMGKRRRRRGERTGYREYLVRCVCGRELWVGYPSLQHGSVKSCGCRTVHKHPPLRLEEQLVGRVRVMRWDEERGEWEGVCEACGEVVYGRGVGALRSHYTASSFASAPESA